MLSVLLIQRLHQSLWLDEFPVALVTARGFWEAVSARVIGLLAAPPHFALVYLSRIMFGGSELALRLPSLVAAFAAALVLRRLVQETFDRENADLSLVFFLTNPQVLRAASTARPYTLALLFLNLSAWALVRWHKQGRLTPGLLSAVCASMAVWCHATFLLPGAALALWALWVSFDRKQGGAEMRRRFCQIIVIGLAALVFLTPCFQFTLRPLWGAQHFLARHVSAPRWEDVVFTCSPALCYLLAQRLMRGAWSGIAAAIGVLSLVAAIVMLGLPPMTLLLIPLAALWFRRSGGLPPVCGGATLYLLWLLLPVVTAYVLQLSLGLRVFDARYCMAVCAPAAVLLALMLQPSGTARVPAALTISIGALIYACATGSAMHENWSDALRWTGGASAPRQAAIFVQPCFSEQLSVPWIRDSANQQVLLSPLSYYPVAGEVHYVPCLLEYPPFRKILQDELSIVLRKKHPFVLVTRIEHGVRGDVRAMAEQAGYAPPLVMRFGAIEVAAYSAAL